MCDLNGHGQVDTRESHDCIVMCENEWRYEYCPEDFPELYCENPFICEECIGAWTCEDIFNVTVEVMEQADSNNDGQINVGDDIE
jgi:hypothetical protein